MDDFNAGREHGTTIGREDAAMRAPLDADAAFAARAGDEDWAAERPGYRNGFIKGYNEGARRKR